MPERREEEIRLAETRLAQGRALAASRIRPAEGRLFVGGLPAAPGFWAAVSGGGPLYSWKMLQSDGLTPVVPPVTGEDNAREVNEQIVPDGTIVWMKKDTVTPGYVFELLTTISVLPESFWATITDNAAAPEYSISLGGTAVERNGVLGIAEGTVVRVFGTIEENTGFEYAGGALLPPMEHSFDYIEVWPALALVASGGNACPWIPRGSFPPVVGDNYNLFPYTPPDTFSPTAEYYYGKADGSPISAGGFELWNRNVVPHIRDFVPGEVESWIHLRCYPGEFVTVPANTPVPPDGNISTFSGDFLPWFIPLPYTVTLVYEVSFDLVEGVKVNRRWKRMTCTRIVTGAADGFKVELEGDGTGWVKFRDNTWSAVLVDCPPTDAEMFLRFIPTETCEWGLVQTVDPVTNFWARLKTEVGGGEYTADLLADTGSGTWKFNNPHTEEASGVTIKEVNGLAGLKVGEYGTLVRACRYEIDADTVEWRFTASRPIPVGTADKNMLLWDQTTDRAWKAAATVEATVVTNVQMVGSTLQKKTQTIRVIEAGDESGWQNA